MKTMAERKRSRWLGTALVLGMTVTAAVSQQPASSSYPVYRVTNAPVPATVSPAPAVTPAPPPSAPAKRSQADLEKLVAPIALYPDSLIATILPASVYPLEIVQAARFVANTNNLAKLDEQPWDENVKAVARVPAVIQKMNEDLSWTMELGDAFLAQDKDVMDAIQDLRGKAQKAGTLQTTPQQIVTVTNLIIEKTVEQRVVVVTNTIVQIQPSNPQVVYVPTYNPYTVYYPPPAYVYNPYAPLITFGAGIAVGAIIANNCDWYHGGCYHGTYHSDVNINVNNNYNRNVNVNNPRGPGTPSTRPANAQKWQPDQSRLSKSGSPSAANTARTMDARGWGSGGAGASTGNVGARPSTGAVGARPSTGTAAPRPSTGNVASRPSTGTPSASRPAASPSVSRPSPAPSVSQPRPSPSASRPAPSSSAFSGVNSGSSARNYSSRGASSAGSRGGFSGGGGGRGGGGRR
jgi:hypothetical protein